MEKPDAGLTFGEMEAAFATVHEIASANRTQFQARLRKFLHLGIVRGVGEGRGKVAYFDAGAVAQLALALDLTELGLEPQQVKSVLEDEYPIMMALLMASRALLTKPEGFHDEEVRESDPMSMFLFLDVSALAHLKEEGRSEVNFFYGGIGIVRENILAWTTGKVPRVSLLNVTAKLWHLTRALPERFRHRFIEHVNSWADEKITGEDFDLEAWVQGPVRAVLKHRRTPATEPAAKIRSFRQFAEDMRVPHLIFPEPDGERAVPDAMIVMPGQREIYIDAKLPSGRGVEGMREHIIWLGSQPYRTRFTDKDSYVLAFFPTYALLEEMLAEDPGLWDWAYSHNVLMTGPSDFIAISRVAQLAWAKEKIFEAVAETGLIETSVGKRPGVLRTIDATEDLTAQASKEWKESRDQVRRQAVERDAADEGVEDGDR